MYMFMAVHNVKLPLISKVEWVTLLPLSIQVCIRTFGWKSTVRAFTHFAFSMLGASEASEGGGYLY